MTKRNVFLGVLSLLIVSCGGDDLRKVEPEKVSAFHEEDFGPPAPMEDEVEIVIPIIERDPFESAAWPEPTLTVVDASVVPRQPHEAETLTHSEGVSPPDVRADVKWPEFRVSGFVRVDDDRWAAVIDGRIYGGGDWISPEVQISSIDRERIVLSHRSGQRKEMEHDLI